MFVRQRGFGEGTLENTIIGAASKEGESGPILFMATDGLHKTNKIISRMN